MTVNYTEIITQQKQELEAKLAQLAKIDITGLEAQKAKLLDQVAKVDEEIAAAIKALGITNLESKAASKIKPQGILVSYSRLQELFKEHKTEELSLRGLRLDTPNIKKLVSEHPDSLTLAGKGAWPTVKLKK